MRLPLIPLALFAALTPGCAEAQTSLEDRVTVELQTISIDALGSVPSGDLDAKEQARLERGAPVTNRRDEVLSAFDSEAGGAALPTRFDIQPGIEQFSPWEVEGRVTADSAVYVALPPNWWVWGEGREDITVCTVRFDTRHARDFDHLATLFLVLSAGNCSAERLTDEELLADLKAPIYPLSGQEPLTVQVRAEREFGDASTVQVLAADDFEPIDDWRSVPGDYLGGGEYRQILKQNDLAGTRGWIEASDGETLTFFQSREVQSAMCVYRGPIAGQLFEINIRHAAFLRDATPAFQRFCLEQLEAIDEAYKARLLSDTRPIYTEPLRD